MTVIGRILGFSLLGAVVAPLVMMLLMAAIYMMDSRCGSSGDSGGCEIGMAMTVLASAPVGAAIGLLVGIWKSLRRR